MRGSTKVSVQKMMCDWLLHCFFKNSKKGLFFSQLVMELSLARRDVTRCQMTITPRLKWLNTWHDFHLAPRAIMECLGWLQHHVLSVVWVRPCRKWKQNVNVTSVLGVIHQLSFIVHTKTTAILHLPTKEQSAQYYMNLDVLLTENKRCKNQQLIKSVVPKLVFNCLYNLKKTH